MEVVAEAFRVEQFGDIFLGPFHHAHFGASVEFSSCTCLLSSLALVGYWVVDISCVFFSVVIHCFRLLLTRYGMALEFGLGWDVVVGRKLS